MQPPFVGPSASTLEHPKEQDSDAVDSGYVPPDMDLDPLNAVDEEPRPVVEAGEGGLLRAVAPVAAAALPTDPLEVQAQLLTHVALWTASHAHIIVM